MKCVKPGNIPDNDCHVGTCPYCQSEWEISSRQLGIGKYRTCPLCCVATIDFKPKIAPVEPEKGYVRVSQKNGPDRHYWDGEELKLGVYRIYWEIDSDKPTSLATMFQDHTGTLWCAVADWVNIVRFDHLLTDYGITRLEYLSEKIAKI